MTQLESPGDTRLSLRKAAPSGPTERPACLVHIYPTGPRLGSRHFLDFRPAQIGRAEDCDLRLDDDSVSRRHARIEFADGSHVVADLGSTNGTRVNDHPAGNARALRDGDYLRVGGVIYRYLAGGNVEAEYHEEIYRLTIQDALTRLPNRRALDEFLGREAARAARHARPLSVLLLDLDRFKAVNDAHGHLSRNRPVHDHRQRQFWSFQPVEAVALPDVRDTLWPPLLLIASASRGWKRSISHPPRKPTSEYSSAGRPSTSSVCRRRPRRSTRSWPTIPLS